MKKEIPILTVSSLETGKVVQYVGLITVRNVRASNFVRDIFTAFRDIIGGKSHSYLKIMQKMEEEVLVEVQEKARAMGANAVIGFRLDFDTIGSKGVSLLMAYGIGTAVIIQP